MKVQPESSPRQWRRLAWAGLGLIATIAAAVASAIFMTDPRFSSADEVDRRLAAFMESAPEAFPVPIDEHTDWIAWEADDNLLSYRYTMKVRPEMPSIISARLRDIICQEQEARWLIRAGVRMEFLYENQAGHELFRVEILHCP